MCAYTKYEVNSTPIDVDTCSNIKGTFVSKSFWVTISRALTDPQVPAAQGIHGPEATRSNSSPTTSLSTKANNSAGIVKFARLPPFNRLTYNVGLQFCHVHVLYFTRANAIPSRFQNEKLHFNYGS